MSMSIRSSSVCNLLSATTQFSAFHEARYRSPFNSCRVNMSFVKIATVIHTLRKGVKDSLPVIFIFFVRVCIKLCIEDLHAMQLSKR